MAPRVLVDENGVRWEVRLIIPTTPNRPFEGKVLRHSGAYPRALENGWLSFESPTEKRRLAPAPEGWDSASDEELAAFLKRAVSVPKRLNG